MRWAGHMMKIDNNEKEKKALEYMLKGDMKQGHQLQDEFIKEVKDSGQDHCDCTENCKHHGKCMECVIVHRGHGEHLPVCFHTMVNEKINSLSGLTEHSFKNE
jgi:hypothetical protein